MSDNVSGSKHSSLSDVLRQLDNCKSASQIYNVLVIIRTNHSKGSEAVTKLRHLGGVEKLLKILGDVENIKCQDVALSILGNCCLDDKVRLRVLKCGGIKILCDILREAQKETVRHRACRAITNLCENIACCDAIYDGHAEIIEVIVTSLSETTDKECKITFCRAIRILSDTDEHREIVLSCGPIKPIAAMLSSEDTSVVQAAMKTTMHFVNNCSEECTRQLAAEGVLSSLVSLTSSASSSVATTATTILLSVATNVPRLRPFLSGAGAVQFFIRQVIRLQDSLLESRNGYRAVDAICHCCRDANSRMKLREYDGLELLVRLLSRERFALIHDRIISSLVCFLFDDAGVEGLLQHGFVGTLVRHLYRAASITRQNDVIELDWLKSSRVKTVSGTGHASNYNSSNKTNEKTSMECELTGTSLIADGSPASNTIMDIVPTPSGLAKVAAAENPDSSININIDADDEVMVNELPVEGRDAETVIDVDDASVREKSAPSYSMHSPTYKAVSLWRMNANEDDAVDVAPRNIYESAILFTDTLSPPHSYCSSRSASSSPSRSSISSPCRSASPTYSFDSCGSNSPVHGGMHASRSCPVNLGSSSPHSCLSWSGSSPSGSPVHGSFSPFSTVSYLSPSQSSSPSCTNGYNDYDFDFPTTTDADGVESQTILPRVVAPEPALPEVVDCETAPNVNARSQCSRDDQNPPKSDWFLLNNMKIKIEDEESVCKSSSVEIVSSKGCGQHDLHVKYVAPVSSLQSMTNEKMSNVCLRTEPVVLSDCDKWCKDCDEHAESDEDDVLDIEAYQRTRDDQRRFSRMLDIANSMYAVAESSSSGISSSASSATALGLFRKHKRRRSSPTSAMTESQKETDPKQSSTANSAAKARRIDFELNPAVQLCVVKPDTSDLLEEQSAKLELKSEDSMSTSDDGNRKRTAANCQTEKNILNLLSRVSHLPESCSYLINTKVLCALLDYFALAHDPVQTCARILLRFSRDHNCFEVAVLCLYPVLVNRRLDSSWRTKSTDKIRNSREPTTAVLLSQNPALNQLSSHGRATLKEGSGENSWLKTETKPIDIKIELPINSEPGVKLEMLQAVGNVKVEPLLHVEKVKVEQRNKVSDGLDASNVVKKLHSPSDLHDEILANLSVMASSGYGQGVLSHILLRGDDRQRELCAISLCFLCRNVALQRKFLIEMKGIDLLVDLLKDPDGQLFSSVILALSHIIQLLPVSFIEQPVDTKVPKVTTKSDKSLPPKFERKNDLTFVLDDGSKVGACRDILTESSPVFAKMLSGGFKEAAESWISIGGVSLEAMRLLISLVQENAFHSQSHTLTELRAILDCFELFHRFQLPDRLYFTLYKCLLSQSTCNLNFSYTFHVLGSYGLAVLLRDYTLRLFAVDVSLKHRCSAISDIVNEEYSAEFLSILSASLLELICN